MRNVLTRTLYTNMLRTCDIFIEVDGPVRGWFISRLTQGGAALGLGRLQATICPTRAGVQAILLGLTFLGVDAALTLICHRHPTFMGWLSDDPPGLLITWALLAKRLTLS